MTNTLNLGTRGNKTGRVLHPPREGRHALEMTETVKAKHLAEMHLIGFDAGLLDVLNLQTDPRFKALNRAIRSVRTESFIQLMTACNVTLSDLEEITIDFAKRRGKIKMAKKIPEIMEKVANAALGIERVCDQCKGIGRIEDMAETFPICPACQGAGKVHSGGDIDSQKLTFEVMGMGPKSSPLVNLNMGYTGTADLVGSASDILRGTINVTPENAQQ